MMRFIDQSRPYWSFVLLAAAIAPTSGDGNRWPALTSSIATTGDVCVTPCLKYSKPLKGNFPANGYVCEVLSDDNEQDGDSETTRSCSPAPGLDSLGRRCYDYCKPHKWYHSCNQENKEKEFCSNPGKSPSGPHVAQHMTIKGEPCISSCTHEGESYSWCYKAGGGSGDCSLKPGFGIKGKECHERKCDYDGESYTWCWLKEDRKDWSKCGQVKMSSIKVDTLLGSKCVTPCVLDGVGTINRCRDASGEKKECSRIPNLASNNIKCHTKCDTMGGTGDEELQERYYWCYTSADKSSSWSKCSEVRDNPLVVNGSEPNWLAEVEYFPMSEINPELLISGAKGDIFGIFYNQGISEFTFFERLGDIAVNNAQEFIDNDEKLQNAVAVCLAHWKNAQFRVEPFENSNPFKLAFADEERGEIGVKLEQRDPHKLNEKEYLVLQLTYSGYRMRVAGARSKIAEVLVPVEVVQKSPEYVVDALLRSMYGGFKVHIGRFRYHYKKRIISRSG